MDLVFYYFLSHFYFPFDLFFIFSIFRTLRLGLEVINHISHIWWCGHNIDYRTWKKVIEDSRTSDIVVATTCQNGTCDMLTSAKLSVGYLVVGIIRELDKELLLHCSSIYINTRWSVLQQYVYLMSYYSSTMLLPQGHHAISMCPNIILFNLHHHVYTMYTPWETIVSWCHP